MSPKQWLNSVTRRGLSISVNSALEVFCYFISMRKWDSHTYRSIIKKQHLILCSTSQKKVGVFDVGFGFFFFFSILAVTLIFNMWLILREEDEDQNLNPMLSSKNCTFLKWSVFCKSELSSRIWFRPLQVEGGSEVWKGNYCCIDLQ